MSEMTDPRRRRRWARGLAAVAILLMLGTAVAFQASVHWIIERELTRALDARVRIERLHVSPFGGRLTATDLAISEKLGGEPLLRIRDVEIQVLLGALWDREILITRLRLEQPEAWLARTPGGISWLPTAMPGGSGASRWALTLREVEVRGGRVHVADRRRAPEHRELVERIDIDLRDLSTRDDRREARPGLSLSGHWRGMTLSAEGWIAPFARLRALHLPMRIARADLGQVAGILPPGLAPPGLAGEAEAAVDLRGEETEGGWQVEAGVKVEAHGVTARPRPGLTVQGKSVRLAGQGHWDPGGIGFSQLTLDLAGVTVEAGDRLRASLQRAAARGQANLDHRGLLVPELAVEATGLSLGRAGKPPAVQVGRLGAAGGTDQRAGTARLERVRLTDVNARAVRKADGSVDIAEWLSAFGQAGISHGEARPLYWEVLQLEVERADLDLTDQASGPERSLAVRDAGLRLEGVTSDPAHPIGFDLTASTSVAPGIALKGTWIRSPVQLVATLTVREADLPAVRSWLPAALPVEVPSGRADLALQGELQAAPDGLAASGSADLTVRTVRLLAGTSGSVTAEEIEVSLAPMRAMGPHLGDLRIEAQGRVRGRTVHGRTGESEGPASVEASAGEIQVGLERMELAPRQGGARVLTIQGHAAVRDLHARAPGYGIESLAAQEVGADLPEVATGFGPDGVWVEGPGRLSLTRAEGKTPGLPVRAWSAAGVRAEIARLQPAPFRLHLRRAEVNEPELQVVRAAEGAEVPSSGAPPIPPIRLDHLVVRDGKVAFQDETVRPPWSAGLTQVEAVIEGLDTDRDAPVSFRLSAEEASGARLRLNGQMRPATWAGEVHAEVENLDVLRPAPYLPDLVLRVVRGGTAAGALDLDLRLNGEALEVTGKGELTLAPLELGDARRQLTLLLANEARIRVDALSLDPLGVRLGTVRLEEPWIAVGRDRDGTLPGLRLVNELRQAAGAGSGSGDATPPVTIGQLTVTDGIAEIDDRAVRPRFRDQVQNLQVSIEGLTTAEARKAAFALTGELSDRSRVSLKGFILPLPTNLYVDVEGEIRDFNLHRLNPYTTRVTSYRLERGKLSTQVRYRIEQNRLEGENVVHIDQLALGEQVEPIDRFEALVGVPLAMAVSLLQDTSGEIILRVPVHGELDRPEFDLGEVISTAVQNAVRQVLTAPFQAIGQIFTLGGRIGAIEIAPVLFAPGSWALDDPARAHLQKIGALMRDRPGMKVKLSGMAHVESDVDGLRAAKVEAELQQILRGSGVTDRDGALDRLFLRTFGASTSGLTREEKHSRLKAVQKVRPREVRDLPDARTLSIYDYMAGVEGIDRSRIFLAEGKVYRTAEGGGDWARRADFTILKP